MITMDQLKRNRNILEAELAAAGSTIRGSSCTCPSPDHDDQHPSTSIYHNSRGNWRVSCKACGFAGDFADIRAVITGKPLAQVLREIPTANALPTHQRQKTPPQTAQAEPARDMLPLARRYHEAITPKQIEELAAVLGVSGDALRRLCLGIRCDVFAFPMRDSSQRITGIRLRTRQGRKFSETGGKEGLFIPRDMRGDGPLIVCEGPSDCAAALDAGFDAIGRSNNVSRGADDLLHDYIERHPRREVWIVTDRDEPGSSPAKATAEAAERLARRLERLVEIVKVFAPPEGVKDLRAWRNSGADQDDIEARADATSPRGPAGRLSDSIEAEITGRRQAVPFPWRLLSRGSQALLPGSVTVLCGDPGCGKSLLMLQAIAYWHDLGVPLAVYELEEPVEHHLRRLLAQQTGAAWLTSIESVASRGDEARSLAREHEAWSASIGRVLWDAPDKPVTLAALADWICKRAEAGCRVIVIDPVTAADAGERPWDEDRRFLRTVGPVLERCGASLLVVTHPRKQKNRATASSLDDLAGGSAWQRFTQTVLWLEKLDDPKAMTVKQYDAAMPFAETVTVDRRLRLLKCRNGIGTGWLLAFDFDCSRLTFRECGAVVKRLTGAEV